MNGWWREYVSKRLERSSDWPRVRKWFVKANPVCKVCGKEKVHVHHIKPFHLYPEKELDVTNLISLCSRCHLLFGHGDNWKTYVPTVRGDAIKMSIQISQKRKV